MLREYDDVEPVILSGEWPSLSRLSNCGSIFLEPCLDISGTAFNLMFNFDFDF